MKITAIYRDSGVEIPVKILGLTDERTPSGKMTIIIGADGKELGVDSAEFFAGCDVFSDGKEATLELKALVFPTVEAEFEVVEDVDA